MSDEQEGKFVPGDCEDIVTDSDLTVIAKSMIMPFMMIL
jgi:hypothetical protein